MPLPSTITLEPEVGVESADTDVVYSRYDDTTPNRVIFNSEENVLGVTRDTLTAYRTFPKRNGISLGVKKSAVKLTRDFTVENTDDTTQIAPLIIEMRVSMPVGVTSAEAELATRQFRDLLDQPTVIGAVMNDLEL